ncbi:hypothetical protein JPSP49_14850 [Staphylococcus pseudintermedius]|nr:hypothetical protein GSP_08010 [Staphylococcus pseudintermedius]
MKNHAINFRIIRNYKGVTFKEISKRGISSFQLSRFDKGETHDCKNATVVDFSNQRRMMWSQLTHRAKGVTRHLLKL